MRAFVIPFTLAALLSASVLSADVVTLQNGATLEGIVQREGKRVRVELEFGSITVEDREVSKIESRRSALELYRERAAALPEGDAAARLRLAVWCRQQGLDASAREQYEGIIALDPDNAEARGRLGYRRQDGVWMTEDEYWKARGYVWRNGAWLSPAEFAAEREEARRAEEERARDEREAARQRERALEQELARAREEADRRTRDYGGAATVYGAAYYPGGYFAGGGVPWWFAPSWQNPHPTCDLRQGVRPAPAERSPEPWHVASREPWHVSGSEPWHVVGSEPWHAMAPGWGGRQ